MKIVLCFYYCGQIYLVSLDIFLIIFYNYKYKNAYTCIWASLVALVVKNLPANAGDTGDAGSIPESRRFPWRRKWLLIPVSLPGEFHGQRSMVGYNPWVTKSQT